MAKKPFKVKSLKLSHYFCY